MQFVTIHLSWGIWHAEQLPLNRWRAYVLGFFLNPIGVTYASNFIRLEFAMAPLFSRVAFLGSPPVIKSEQPQPLAAFDINLPFP